jgi:type IV pilus assembly protein PilA
MKNEQGFSLVELLIVVAIIAIIAAIAVPSLLTARQAANEAGAIQGCRTVGSAEIAFSATNNQQYDTIANLVTANFLDNRFNGTFNGYTYATAAAVTGCPQAGATPNSFGATGTPAAAGMGRYIYGIGPDQVVRWQGAAAGSSLPTGVTAGDGIGAVSAGS